MLMNNEFFRETVAKIWRELYEETNGFENVIHAVSRISEVYAEELSVEKELWDRANDQAKLPCAGKHDPGFLPVGKTAFFE